MKFSLLLPLFLLLSACGVTAYHEAAQVSDLSIQLVEPGWSGKVIPDGQQCKKFGGNGHSPQLYISHIPGDAQAIIVEFSDRSWFPMNHGGHGKIGIVIKPGQTELRFPSVAGESFELPNNRMFIFHQHRGGRGEPGAYLPPCSGGRGNQYYADVKAVKQVDIDQQTAVLVGQGSIMLGTY